MLLIMCRRRADIRPDLGVGELFFSLYHLLEVQCLDALDFISLSSLLKRSCINELLVTSVYNACLCSYSCYNVVRKVMGCATVCMWY